MNKVTLLFIISISQYPLNALSQNLYGVSYSVAYSKEKCGEEFPLHVTIKNRTYKNLLSYSFTVEAIRPGYSTVLYKQRYRSDRIIKRFSTEELCFAFDNGSPHPVDNRQIEADRYLTPTETINKYGFGIGERVISWRASNDANNLIVLDPKYSIQKLELSISSSYERFD